MGLRVHHFRTVFRAYVDRDRVLVTITNGPSSLEFGINIIIIIIYIIIIDIFPLVLFKAVFLGSISLLSFFHFVKSLNFIHH